MKHAFVITASLLLLGCGRAPTMADIREYGEQRFIDEVIAVADGEEPSAHLIQAFRPLRVEAHLNGAWLVYRESSRYVSGVYVDRESLDDWGGSGMAVTRWSNTIAWTREKIRRRR